MPFSTPLEEYVLNLVSMQHRWIGAKVSLQLCLIKIIPKQGEYDALDLLELDSRGSTRCYGQIIFA
jgi:hypothetical protein